MQRTLKGGEYILGRQAEATRQRLGEQPSLPVAVAIVTLGLGQLLILTPDRHPVLAQE